MRWKQAYAAAACAILAAGPLRAEQFNWNNSSGGAYSTGANWTGTVSPAGTVPDDPNTVLFNLGSAAGYTVTVDGSRDVGGFTVRNDRVTLAMDGANFSLGSAVAPPLAVGTGGSGNLGVLVLLSASSDIPADESVINTGNTTLGSAAGARGMLTVSSAAGPLFWNNHGNITIGAAGAAAGSLLAINAGGAVTVDNTVSLFAGATLNLNGGSLAMGAFSRASSGTTFLWSTGVMQITGSAVTVDAGGIFGNGSLLGGGQELDALAGLTISAAGTLQLAGGTLVASAIANNGTLAFTAGNLDITSADVTIDAGGILNSGNVLSAGKSLTVAQTTSINAGRTLQLSGGTLSTGALAIAAGGALAFNSGTLQLTNTDLTLAPGGLLGAAVTLNAGRNLIVTVPDALPDDGITTLGTGGSLVVSGGLFSTGRFAPAGGSLDFTSGTFALTASAVSIDAGGFFGTSSTFGAGRNLNISGAVIIAAGGTLTLSGGSVVAGGLVNNGTIVFSSGTLAINGDDLQIGPGTPLGAAFSVNANMTLETDGGSTLDLNDGGVLTLNGGTVNAAQIAFYGGQLVFNTGTLKLNETAFAVDADGPLGAAVMLSAGQAVVAPLGTVITPGAHVTVNGGRLSTGSISGSIFGLAFVAGEIDLTATTLSIASGGLFGTSLTLPSTQTLSVADTTTIASGSSLTLTGGSLITAGLVNNGTFTFTSGTLHISRDAVTIGTSGIFGTAASISAGKSLIADASMMVTSGQTLTVSGGTVLTPVMNVGQATSGTISHSGGTIGITNNLVIGVGLGFSANYDLSGSGTLNAGTLQLTNTNGLFTQSGGTANVTQLTLDSGTHVLAVSGGTFSATQTQNNATIRQTGGTLNGGFITGGGIVQLSSGAVATADSLRQSSLAITGTARLTLNSSTGDASTSTLGALSITGAGALDLNNTDMVFYSSSGNQATDYANLLALVNAGRSSGLGIISSAAQAAAAAHGNNETTALAVVCNDLLPVPLTTFGGVPVDGNSILFKYTYVGDATLDGVVDIDDYLALDYGYLHHLTGWQNGDFDNNGTINAADYADIDRVYLSQGGPLASGLIAEHEAEFGAAYLEAYGVPEPASLWLLTAGGIMLLRRRKFKAWRR